MLKRACFLNPNVDLEGQEGSSSSAPQVPDELCRVCPSCKKNVFSYRSGGASLYLPPTVDIISASLPACASICWQMQVPLKKLIKTSLPLPKSDFSRL